MFDTLRAKKIISENCRKAICHYVLIYLMITMGDSFLYDRVLTNFTIPIVLVLIMIVLMNRNYQLVYPISILGLGLVTMLAVRASTGAMGPTELISWAAMIGITFIAVRYDTSKFIVRVIRLTAVLTAFSLVVFFISQIMPGFWGRVSPISFLLTFGDTLWLDSVNKIVSYYQANGLFLYVDRGFDPTRNVGIFREPAVYQILLNSMIFVLLFMRPPELKDKHWKILLLLYIAAVATTRSATGYATTFLILFAYFATTRKKSGNVSIAVPILLGIACSIMILVAFLGNSNWVADSVFGRFIEGGKISLDASGQARVGAANAALSLIPQYPFGCGYDVYGESISTGTSEFVGACLLKVAAVYGVIMGLGILSWVFYPIFRSKDLGLSAKLSFAAMYFIATYLECEVFYTTLIFIPLYLYCKDCETISDLLHMHSNRLKDEVSKSNYENA